MGFLSDLGASVVKMAFWVWFPPSPDLAFSRPLAAQQKTDQQGDPQRRQSADES